MKCEIVTGNMSQLWEDLLSQLHEKEYPSESIRHYGYFTDRTHSSVFIYCTTERISVCK